jgi:integrase
VLFTGLRIGEAQTLLGVDLRLAERRITVGQQRRLKTELSARDVPIPPPLAELHAEHRLRFYHGPADPVFPFPYNSYQRAHRVFRAACVQAGLHQVHIHDLRHTFGVHCAKAGIPLARIQKLMGHATPVMTLRYLKHAPESYFSEDAARLAASLTGAHDREAEAAVALLRQGFRPA